MCVCGVHVVCGVCGVLSVCMHVECMRECLCMCVWYVMCGGVEGCVVWSVCACVCVWCGVYVRVCVECECDQKQTSLPLGPYTEYTWRQTAHTSLPWDCSPQGTDYTEAYPWHPFRATRVCVVCRVCGV